MSFEEIKKNFGFGCMRMKMDGEEVDREEFCRMIDAFLAAGFNYFDTAHVYLDGKSELALRECLVRRYPRSSFVLANKLTPWCFEEEAQIRPFFEMQCEACGVDYFDFYLFHATNASRYEHFQKCNAFEIVRALKEEGRIRHIAMSFHDTPEVLDGILREHPEIEAVQLQINYLDYDDPGVQSKACYDVAVKYGKQVIVMEPVKGGLLANPPKEAVDVLSELGEGSCASKAIRFAASYPAVFMTLSGMGNMEMMEDNLRAVDGAKPYGEAEFAVFARAREVIRQVRQIPCTACNYCAELCPQSIRISGIFAAYNQVLAAKKTRGEAKALLPETGGAAADCVGCGACESVCPQKIEIKENLATIARRLK
ncbi:MAG: aldo/keto reductase [Clostridia bacterium]|nr:aldo/keto reductase [Clostridia bacterium]